MVKNSGTNMSAEQKIVNKIGFIYDEIYLLHKPIDWHPERPERLISILTALEERVDLKDKINFLNPDKANEEDLLSVHSESHVKNIMTKKSGYLDPDTYISEHSLEAALFAAGALKRAVDEVKERKLKYVFCAVRPPGHHATKDKAMGFCLFNNAAIGARYAQQKGFRKIFIIDFDVHHGNGTQEIFYDDDSVFYFSTHQFPHYPGSGSKEEKGVGKGLGFTYNVPLQFGTGDKEFREIYEDVLTKLISKFNPDLLIVSAGYDIRKEDPLANLNVTDDGIRFVVKSILDNNLPTIFTLEGGYNLDALSRSVIITLEELISKTKEESIA